MIKQISLFALLMVIAAPAMATDGALPIPRFVSLASTEVNLRTGPGTRYPIQWVYTKKHLPVEIINEFDTWRKVKDIQGDEGWVHQTMVSGYRYGIIKDDEHIVRSSPDDDSIVIARLEPGVIVKVDACELNWCDISVDGNYKGWVEKDALWGVYPQEIFD